jgi:hypothetical protein
MSFDFDYLDLLFRRRRPIRGGGMEQERLSSLYDGSWIVDAVASELTSVMLIIWRQGQI